MVPFIALGVLEGVKLGIEISAGIIGGKSLYPAIKEGLGCNKPKKKKKKGGILKKAKEKLKKVSDAAEEDDLFEDIDDYEVEDNI